MGFAIDGRKKEHRIFGYIAFGGMVIASVLAIIANTTNIFEPKVIGHKYCYFYNQADTSSQFEQVMSSDDEQ